MLRILKKASRQLLTLNKKSRQVLKIILRVAVIELLAASVKTHNIENIGHGAVSNHIKTKTLTICVFCG
jgi:hypothetical protein